MSDLENINMGKRAKRKSKRERAKPSGTHHAFSEPPKSNSGKELKIWNSVEGFDRPVQANIMSMESLNASNSTRVAFKIKKIEQLAPRPSDITHLLALKTCSASAPVSPTTNVGHRTLARLRGDLNLALTVLLGLSLLIIYLFSLKTPSVEYETLDVGLLDTQPRTVLGREVEHEIFGDSQVALQPLDSAQEAALNSNKVLTKNNAKVVTSQARYPDKVIENVRLLDGKKRAVRFSVRNLSAQKNEGYVYAVVHFRGADGKIQSRAFPQEVELRKNGSIAHPVRGIRYAIDTLVYKQIEIPELGGEIREIKVYAHSDRGLLSSTSARTGLQTF